MQRASHEGSRKGFMLDIAVGRVLSGRGVCRARTPNRLRTRPRARRSHRSGARGKQLGSVAAVRPVIQSVDFSVMIVMCMLVGDGRLQSAQDVVSTRARKSSTVILIRLHWSRCCMHASLLTTG